MAREAWVGNSFRIENGCLPMAKGADPLTDGEFLGSPATAKTTRTRIPVIIASTATAWPSPTRGLGKVIPRPPEPRTSERSVVLNFNCKSCSV